MPPTDGCDDIVNAWLSMGRVSPVGMDVRPLVWSEIQAYSTMTGNDLTGWPAKQVRMMSEVYLSALNEYTEPMVASPWDCGVDGETLRMMRIDHKLMEAKRNRPR